MAEISRRPDVNPQEGRKLYGRVAFADATNRKYPIDTAEHVRAAWSYINQEHNAAKYSPREVKTIKGHITHAARELGVAILDAGDDEAGG